MRERLVDFDLRIGDGGQIIFEEFVRQTERGSTYFSIYRLDLDSKVNRQRDFKSGAVNAETTRARWKRRTGRDVSQSDVYRHDLISADELSNGRVEGA